MEKLKEFVKTTIVGGLLVILPLAIFLLALSWVFNFVQKTISPLTTVVIAQSPLRGIVADILVISLILIACFLVGLFVRTKLGELIYASLETIVLRKAPGYSLIKETVFQFLGRGKSPFASVALVRIFGNDTLASAFITDTHNDGSYTVFVPTGPNPTSGNIYHLKGENVYPVKVPIEDAMRSIISCGAGSSALIAKYKASSQPRAVDDGV